MARSDFAWVNFDEQFTNTNGSATRTFNIEGSPFGTGYLLIQGFDIERSNHGILINGQELPSFDLVRDENNRWNLWMDRIPSGFLLANQENRITIERRSPDNFTVANVVVHWRENG